MAALAKTKALSDDKKKKVEDAFIIEMMSSEESEEEEEMMTLKRFQGDNSTRPVSTGVPAWCIKDTYFNCLE